MKNVLCLKKGFHLINLLILLFCPQKVIGQSTIKRISVSLSKESKYQNISNEASVKKSFFINNFYFILADERITSFQMENDSIFNVKTFESKYVKDAIVFDNKIFFLSQNKLSLIDPYSDKLEENTYSDLSLLDDIKSVRIKKIHMYQDFLYLLTDFFDLVEIDLKGKEPFIKSIKKNEYSGVKDICFINGNIWIMTRTGLYINNSKKPIYNQEISSVNKSNSEMYFFGTPNGKIIISTDLMTFSNFIETKNEEIRNIIYDGSLNRIWVLGRSVMLYTFSSKELMDEFGINGKVRFQSEESECLSFTNNSNQVLIGTLGSGMYLFSYNPVKPPFISQRDTKSSPIAKREDNNSQNSITPPTNTTSKKIIESESKKELKSLRKSFIIYGFDVDSHILKAKEVNDFFLTIKKELNFDSIEVQKIIFQGYASETDIGGKRSETNKVSQKRIDFIRSKFYSFFPNLDKVKVVENNLSDSLPIDSSNFKSAKNRAVIIIFEYTSY